jgi:hypothetical protein
VSELEDMWIRGSLGLILGISAILLEGRRKAARDFDHNLWDSEPGQYAGGSALGYRQVRG